MTSEPNDASGQPLSPSGESSDDIVGQGSAVESSAVESDEVTGMDFPHEAGDEQAASVVEQAGDDNNAQDEDEISENDPHEEEQLDDGPVEPLELVEESDAKELNKDWYILKVQSNREKSIVEGLQRRVKIAGLEDYFSEIIVPTEDVAEFKNGKKRIVKRKLYPGYIVVHLAITEETWFLVRETTGIGDFAGTAGKPSPLLPHEVERILKSSMPAESGADTVKTVIPFKPEDRVRIKEGTFENFEGDVDEIDEANGRITVMINIFGRSTPVELEHWQVEAV